MSRDMKHGAPEEWLIDPSALGEAIFPSERTGPECSAAPSCEKGRGQKRGDCSGRFAVTVKERRCGLSGFNSRTPDRLCHCCGRQRRGTEASASRKSQSREVAKSPHRRVPSVCRRAGIHLQQLGTKVPGGGGGARGWEGRREGGGGVTGRVSKPLEQLLLPFPEQAVKFPSSSSRPLTVAELLETSC